jgi:hypothetical protein
VLCIVYSKSFAIFAYTNKDKDMRTLSISLSGSHCCEFFRYDGILFKVVVRNGNCYFDCDVYRETINGDFAHIACRYDIEGIESIPYNNSDERKISIAQQNIQRAKEWIRVIYTK